MNKKVKICFFVKTNNPELFKIVDFYSNDIKIFRELGYEVILANNFNNIPKDCDIYFIWWWTSGIIALLYAKFIKKPAIMIGNLHYTDPSIQGYNSKPFYLKMFIKYCLRNSNVQIATSQLEYEEILNLKPFNLKMIYHAIDLSKYQFEDYNKREPILFTITHLTKHNVRRKCVNEIIDAFNIIHMKYPDYILYIAGGKDDSGFKEVQKKVNDLNLNKKVVFMGRISDIDKIKMYQKCKIYIQPSYYEGFGLAIAESMACGAPVLTSKKGAIPEVVGDNAIFTEPDKIEEISEGISILLNDAEKSKQMGINGRARIENLFSFEKRKQLMKSLIDDICKEILVLQNK